MSTIDIAKLKHQLHLYGSILGMREARASQADLDALRQVRAMAWRAQDGSVHWNYSAIRKRYTQLAALRAHLRGRLHFSPKTNLEEAHFIYGVPCMASEKTANGWHHVFSTITPAVQAKWVEELLPDFVLKEETEVKVAG